MTEDKVLEMIKRNAIVIKNIENPNDEMKLTAIRKDGLMIRYVKNPTKEMQALAIESNCRAIEFIETTYDMKKYVVSKLWTTLEFIESPCEELIKIGLLQKGYAIKYAKNPSVLLQRLAIEKDYDSIRYIDKPIEEIQVLAIKRNYDALRYIENATLKAELLAIEENEAAIKFISNIDESKKVLLLKHNALVMKYIGNELPLSTVETAFKEVLSKENISEKYVRDFINCHSIDEKYGNISMDKMIFIYKYGSTVCKKIAVDEKLKMV